MISRSIQGWHAVLLGALTLFVLIPVLTWSYLKEPEEPCQVAALSVDVDGKLVKMPLRGAIEVEPESIVVITAEIETKPDACEGAFWIDWRLLSESGLSMFETISETPTRWVLRITVGTQATNNHVVLTVLDSSGVKERVSLPLKVRGE